MEPDALLAVLSTAEKLKCNLRHCSTSSGRQESVAEHSWRLALMAFLVKDEFPEADMDKVIHMCLIHDLGEAFTGDIPAFQKNTSDCIREDQLFSSWIQTLPDPYQTEFRDLLKEMNALETEESKIYKALDKLEAVIQHNESDLRTWLPLEYELQFTYASDSVSFSPYLQRLKTRVDQWTHMKIRESQKEQDLS